MDVQPDVQLRPIRKREDANALPFVDFRIENVPKLRPLIFRIPLPVHVTKRINSFFRSRLLFVSPRSAECRVEPAFRKCIQQRFRLQEPATFLRSQQEGIGARFERFPVLVHDQFRANLFCIVHLEIRSSRETCSWCPRAAKETVSSPDRTPSAPTAASRRNLCRWNKASPAGKTPQPLPAEYKCSRLRELEDDSVFAPRISVDTRIRYGSRCYVAEQLLRRTCHLFFPLVRIARPKTKNPPTSSSLAVGSINSWLE